MSLVSSGVSVYGKPGCVQCKFTTKTLDTLGISYEYHDITENQVARQRVEQMGLKSLPVVQAGERRWTGFSPDKIKELAETPKQMLS